MKSPSQGLRVEALKCFATSTLQRFNAVTFFLAFTLLTANARAQFPDPSVARSVSGQFIINSSPQILPLSYRYYYREGVANTKVIHLELAWLAISAERFKTLVWQQLGLEDG